MLTAQHNQWSTDGPRQGGPGVEMQALHPAKDRWCPTRDRCAFMSGMQITWPERDLVVSTCQPWGNDPFWLTSDQPTIESSKSTDMGIYCGLSFLVNVESLRNLQLTQSESKEFGIHETPTNFLLCCGHRGRWTPWHLVLIAIIIIITHWFTLC